MGYPDKPGNDELFLGDRASCRARDPHQVLNDSPAIPVAASWLRREHKFPQQILQHRRRRIGCVAVLAEALCKLHADVAAGPAGPGGYVGEVVGDAVLFGDPVGLASVTARREGS